MDTTLKSKQLFFTNFLKQYHTILFIVVTIFLAFFFKTVIPLEWKNTSFTLSVLLKEILLFIIPFLIFPLIVHSIIDISSSTEGLHLLIIIIFATFFSNFLSMLIAYGASSNFIPLITFAKNIKSYEAIESVYPLLTVDLCKFSILQTLLGGVAFGSALIYFRPRFLLKIIEKYYYYSRLFLEKLFVFFLPLYIIGNVLKVTHEIDFVLLIPTFGSMILLLFLTQTIYIVLLFFIGCGFNLFQCISAMKNTLPAFMLGFSTMSSLITMPVTLKAAEKNTGNSSITRLTITTTVNFHDIGDCISLPFIALTIIYAMIGSFPEFQLYLLFAFFAAIAQFSAVSVPGGSIIIILPFLTKYLGFTEEMASLIIALSLLVEPIGTAMNVMGNSAFVIIMDRAFKSIKNIIYQLRQKTSTTYIA